MRTILFLVLSLLATGCATPDRLPAPPPMPLRTLGPPPATSTVPGEQLTLADGDVKFILYTPPAYESPASGRERVTLHFHGAPWFAIDEHRRRGLDGPLACIALGEGSSVYRRPFEDPWRLRRILGVIEATLTARAGRVVRIESIDITSFSAGYGAVREIVKNPEYLGRIRRVILADSMYAGWDPATTQPGATSRPLAEQIDVWLPLAERAMDGKASFTITYSQVPTPYVSSSACARAIADELGLKFKPATGPATEDPRFPLVERADAGRLHLWGYGGTDGPAHLTHARHLADVWKALDDVER